MRTRFSLLLAVIGLAAGCLDVSSPTRERLLTARRLTEGIELTNHSDRTLYVFPADPDTLAVLDWTPCSIPDACGGIAGGTAQAIPFDEIEGYSEETRDVVILHWFLVPDGEGFKPDTVRGLLLRLR